jgi:hypothetical protein
MQATASAVMDGKTVRVCAFIKHDGTRCQSHVGIGADGCCLRHSTDPSRKALAGLASLRGGARTGVRNAKIRALPDSALPPLDSPQAAEEWAAIIGRAVATGRLSAHAGNTSLRAVAEYRTSHDLATMSRLWSDLMDALDEWRRTDDPAAALKIVETFRKRNRR